MINSKNAAASLGNKGLFIAYGFFFLASCSSTITKPALETIITWPPLSVTPKISYEGTIEKPDDIIANKGFFRKAIDLLLGKTSDRLIRPYGIVVDSNDRLIVVDTAIGRLQIFDRKTGNYTWIEDFGNDSLNSPIGVAVDSMDNIYVSEPELNKIIVFNKKKRFLFEIKENLNRPTGLAINKKDGILYVVNTGAHNISVYDLNGKLQRVFGQRGRDANGFNYPTNIFIDNEQRIYITDSMNFRIQIFDKNERFISMFGRQGDGSGSFARPKGVAVDADGNIYVVDALFDAVQIFNRDGQLLLSFGSTGSGRGEFWLPTEIFVDNNNRIYVSDSFNRRVQIFKYLKENNKLSENAK